MIHVRVEQPGDHAAVRRILEAAFETPTEARLVEALRPVAEPQISMVAVDEADRVVGHIFYSPVRVEPESPGTEPWTALGLAPMAVLPDHQRRGFGSALVSRSLEHCREAGHPVVFVLGHPEYYPRFGFEPAPPKGLRSAYDVPDNVFMVAELTPGALARRRGRIKYRPEFAQV